MKNTTFYRDRIKEFKRIPIHLIRQNDKNWRTHPSVQKKVLHEILSDIGYSDALIVREGSDGTYTLIDGHLRTELTSEQDVPVLVLDVSDEEADKLLLLMDPVASMADKNDTMLNALISDVNNTNKEIQQLIDHILLQQQDEKDVDVQSHDLLIPEVYQIVLECQDENEQKELYNEFLSRNLKCKLLNI